jgi:hypothetical protein
LRGGERLARPQKEGLDYFPHDVYASSDVKIEPLILLYGAKGYAFYFLHLEYIYRNSELEFDISDAETREVIQQKLHISAAEYNQILETTLKTKLFDKTYYDDTQKITSEGIKKRASIVLEKRERMRLVYEQKISAAETTHIKERKVKKSKVNNISNSVFTPPSLDEVIAYCKERKNSINPQSFIDHYTASNWFRGKTKITNWKACVRTWEQNDKKKPDKPPPSNATNFKQREYSEEFYDKLKGVKK